MADDMMMISILIISCICCICFFSLIGGGVGVYFYTKDNNIESESIEKLETKEKQVIK